MNEKFRVWDDVNKKLIYVDVEGLSSEGTYKQNFLIIDNLGWSLWYINANERILVCNHKNPKNKLLKCSGNFYEGDIIKGDYSWWYIVRYGNASIDSGEGWYLNYVGFYLDEVSGVRKHFLKKHPKQSILKWNKDYEYIGNIFENPEKVKGI